jgi:hypothetical protein
MKKKCGFKARQRPQFVVKSLGLALSLTMIVAVTGCGKKEAPTSNTATQSGPAQPASPAASPHSTEQQSTAAPIPQTQVALAHAAPVAPAGPDLAEINRSLIRWIVRNRRRPNSFEDFASSAGAPIPPAPGGKKYIIGANMHVQLVNQ